MKQVFHSALLLKARVELGLTQEQAASAAGVDVRTYRRYESGEVNDPAAGFSVRTPARRRIIERLCEELGLAEEELLMDGERSDGVPAPAPAPAPAPGDEFLRAPLHAHTLQRARHFIGREDLLQRLSAWASEARPDTRIIALVAVGGAGKTAVAERFALSLGDEPRPGGAFIYSFYEDARAESFLAQALAYFDPSAIEGPPGERTDRLLAALRRGPPHKLVLDGLEILQAEGGAARRGESARAHGEICDPPLRRLFLALARGLGGSRALVTSRFELTDLAAWEGSGLQTIHLPSLSEPEGADLLARWGIRANSKTLLELSSRSGGHALSVAMVGSYVGTFLGGDPSRLDITSPEGAARDDVLARRLHAVLSAYAAALSPEERDLLARLCVFPTGVSEGVLFDIAQAGGSVAGALAGLSRADIGKALARLARLGLVSSWVMGSERRASTHPFLRDHFKALLTAPADRIRVLAESEGRARAYLAGRPQGPPDDRALLDAFESLLYRSIEAGRHAEAFGIYARSMGGFSHLGLRLGEMSRGARVMRAFAEADDPARIIPSIHDSGAAAIAYDWGLYSGALGDLAFAVRCYEAHNTLAERQGDAPALATGLRTLAYTERLRGRLSLAKEHIERSIAVAEAGGGVDHEMRGRALLGAILHDLGEIDAAEAAFRALRSLGAQPLARRGLWEAEHHIDVGRLDLAREVTRRNLEVCAKLGWGGHVAHCHVVLGIIDAAEGAKSALAAREHLAAARAWAGNTGEVEMALRCRDLAARIDLAEGRAAEASEEIAAGHSLAEALGFGLFVASFASLSADASAILRCPDLKEGRRNDG